MIEIPAIQSERSKVSDPNKPPYRVPSMDEICALPWNGLKVVSTFSGCGGSCLGYRMAGFRVVWANEFVPAAQNSYRANATEGCYLDCRDIRQVQPQEILDQCGFKQGELDLFDGSPPCQAFSTAGKRAKGWGKAKTYEHGASQCNETLFTEYIRLLRGLMPKVFVAENVSGLVKGVAKGYFLEILRDLKASGYRVTCKLLDAQWLGVPQSRKRTIFVGVREDLKLEPAHPKPLRYQYSVRDALPWIDRVAHDTGGQFPIRIYADAPSGCILASRPSSFRVLPADTQYFKVKPLPPSRLKGGAYGVRSVQANKPCPTVTSASPGNDLAVEDCRPCRSVTSDDSFGSRGTVKRKFTIAELKRICAFPDDFILTGSYAQQWERLGNSVPPVMMFHVAQTIRDEILEKFTGRKATLENSSQTRKLKTRIQKAPI